MAKQEKNSSNLNLMLEKQEKEIKRLHEIEIRLNTALDLMAGIHWWKDTFGVYRGCNQEMVTSLGLNCKEDIIGKTDHELPWSKQADKLVKNDKITMKTGKIQKGKEELVETTDGILHTFIVAKAPIYDAEGNVVGSVGNSLDITRQKELEKELRREKEKTERANQIKSQFIAALNNVLRSPINSISMSIDMIKRTGNHEKIKKFIDIIDEANSSMVPTLEYTSDYAKLDTNDISFIKKPFRIRDYLEEIIDRKRDQAINNGIDLFLDYTKSNDEWSNNIFAQFHKVLSILVDNAIYYTNEGYVRIALDGETKSKEGFVIIEVQDTGIGIATDRLEKIFNISTNEEDSDIPVKLSFCKKMIDIMNGKIYATGKEKEGTKFYIEIPLYKTNKKSLIIDNQSLYDVVAKLKCIYIDDVKERALGFCSLFSAGIVKPIKLMDIQSDKDRKREDMKSADLIFIRESVLNNSADLLTLIGRNINDRKTLIIILSNGSKNENISFYENIKNVSLIETPIKTEALYQKICFLWSQFIAPPKKMLIIEDNLVCQKAVKAALEVIGCSVETAGTGEKAIKMINDNKFDAIFIDIGLPGKSGIVVAKVIRAKLKDNCPPLIALTGFIRGIDVDAMYDYGLFDIILEKPAQVENLESVIKSLDFS